MDDPLTTALDLVRLRRRLPPPAGRRAVRERAGITQAALAGALGVDRASVCRWEAGTRTPRGVALRGYLDVLDRLAREATR